MYFLGKAIYEFKFPTKYLKDQQFSFRNLKSMNSCVHEYVHHLQTTKFCANELKWFHSITRQKSLVWLSTCE